jgi:hypothetical protein
MPVCNPTLDSFFFVLIQLVTGQVRTLLAASHERVYQSLMVCCHHRNSDLKSAGLTALDAFLKEMAVFIADKGKDNLEAKAVFRFLYIEAQRFIDTRVRIPTE